MSTVDDAWRRIEAWRHAPATLATSRPAARLDRDTAWTGFELPPFSRPLAVQDIRGPLAHPRAVSVAVEAGDLSWHWDRRRIPVAASRGAECGFVVGAPSSPLLAASAGPTMPTLPGSTMPARHGLLLRAVAGSLERRWPVDGWWPFVNEHGGLDWETLGRGGSSRPAATRSLLTDRDAGRLAAPAPRAPSGTFLDALAPCLDSSSSWSWSPTCGSAPARRQGRLLTWDAGWSGRGESNPHRELGKLEFYH
jgi:hypothetical protein